MESVSCCELLLVVRIAVDDLSQSGELSIFGRSGDGVEADGERNNGENDEELGL